MKKKLLNFLAALSIAAVPTAFVGAATGTIDTTGPDSDNNVTVSTDADVDVHNETDATLTNNNPQSATSGGVSVSDNTTGGNAASGSADNESELTVDGTVDNSASSQSALSCVCGDGEGSDEGSITNTGPDSSNNVTFDHKIDVDLRNKVDLRVTNNNSQSATTGSVNATHNTTVGDATSGDASNQSTSSITFSVMN